MDALANRVTWCSFQSSQRVFKLVALLVPGFPSLDAKLYSPGETRRFERKKSELRRTKCRYSRFLICNSYFLILTMPVRYGRFEMPKTLSKEEKGATESYAKFVAEPFEAGYGHTVGNSLRRVLLSSLEGAAITAVMAAPSSDDK